MAVALLCSGQGRQHRDMFALTGDVPEVNVLFRHAADLLGGRDPRSIVRYGNDDELHTNRTGQILCTLQALAAATVLRDALPNQLIAAGYSVGEVAAWGVAGLFNPTATLDLVADRAEVMDACTAADDGMLFIRGLPRATVDRLCDKHSAAIAIIDPGEAFVVGGSRAKLALLAVEAKAMNATRVVFLAVNVASHTGRLATASSRFLTVLKHVAVAPLPAGRRLLCGIDGTPVLDTGVAREKLAAQISQTVDWEACLEACAEAGATSFLELGPGSVLSDMVPGGRCLEQFRTLDGARAWLLASSQAGMSVR